MNQMVLSVSLIIAKHALYSWCFRQYPFEPKGWAAELRMHRRSSW